MMKRWMTGIWLLLASSLFAGETAEVTDVRLSCESEFCAMDFVFANANLPSYFQSYKNGILKVGFGQTKHSFDQKKYLVNDLSQWIEALQIKEEEVRGKKLPVFLFTGSSAFVKENKPVLLKKNIFRLQFARPSAIPLKKWSLGASLVPNKSMKAETPTEKALEVDSSRVQATFKGKSKELKNESDSSSSLPKAALGTLTKMSFLKDNSSEKLNLMFSGPFKLNKTLWNKNKLQLHFDSLNTEVVWSKYPSKSVFVIKNIQVDGKVLEFRLKEGIKPIVLVDEKSILLRFLRSSTDSSLALLTMNADSLEYRALKNRLPDDEIQELDAFALERKKKTKAISSSQLFTVNPGERKILVTKEKGASLLQKAAENAKEMLKLKFGDTLSRVELYNEDWYLVKTSGRKGYVHRRWVSYLDELSPTQLDKLKALGGTSPSETTSALTLRADSLLQNRPDEEKVTYSSFGRRDPFIHLSGPSDDGINIDGVQLVGIIWGGDDPKATFVDLHNAGVSYTLKEGDMVMNGKVLKITETEVLFLIHEFGVSRRYTMVLPEGPGGQP
jgi:hypothetical protein